MNGREEINCGAVYVTSFYYVENFIHGQIGLRLNEKDWTIKKDKRREGCGRYMYMATGKSYLEKWPKPVGYDPYNS